MRLGYLLVLAGCGRLGFDPLGSDAEGSGVTPDAEIPLVCTGRIICDGFEAAIVTNWNVTTANGTIGTDNVHAHRGSRALHARTLAGMLGDNRKAEISNTMSLPSSATPRILYARSWGFFPSPHAAAYNQFITFANGSGGGFALGDQNMKLVSNHFNTTDFAESATTALPLDRWVCFQFEIPTDQTGTMRGFVDGIEVADLALPISPADATMTQVFIGIDWPNLAQTIPAIDVWFDDVIIDDAPISCAD